MWYFVVIASFCGLLILLDTFKCEKSIKQLFYGIAVVAFVLLATFRTNAFPDTKAYIEFYNSQIGISLFAPKNTSFEWGTVLLTRLCTLISSSYRMLFFVQAAIVNLIVVIVLKNKDGKLLLYACFMAFYGIYTTFIILRAGLAIAFFALGVLKFEKQWVQRLLCFCIAIVFHISAIPMIVLYLFSCLIKRVNFKAEYVCVIFVALLACYASGTTKYFMILLKNFFELFERDSLLVIKATSYLKKQIEIFSFGLSFRYCLNVLVYLLALYVVQKNKVELSKTMRANIFFVFCGLCLESLLGNGLLIGRLTDFCNVINLSSIGLIIKVNMGQINKFELLSIQNKYAYVGEIKSLQVYSFAIASIFVCMNLVFMYRIAF